MIQPKTVVRDSVSETVCNSAQCPRSLPPWQTKSHWPKRLDTVGGAVWAIALPPTESARTTEARPRRNANPLRVMVPVLHHPRGIWGASGGAETKWAGHQDRPIRNSSRRYQKALRAPTLAFQIVPALPNWAPPETKPDIVLASL